MKLSGAKRSVRKGRLKQKRKGKSKKEAKELANSRSSRARRQ